MLCKCIDQYHSPLAHRFHHCIYTANELYSIDGIKVNLSKESFDSNIVSSNDEREWKRERERWIDKEISQNKCLYSPGRMLSMKHVKKTASEIRHLISTAMKTTKNLCFIWLETATLKCASLMFAFIRTICWGLFLLIA